MKKLIVKAEFIIQEYKAPIEGVEAQSEKWIKGEEVLFEAPIDLTDYIYHPAIEGVEAVAEVPELKEWRVIAQTQGNDEELAQWLAGDSFKYPEGYWVEYIDISAEVAFDHAVQAAQAEIAKGMKGLAVFKVKVKEKGLNTTQIATIFADPSIQKIIATLSTGSLPLAALLIAAYQADGVIVTEEDKAAVIAAIA